MPDLSIAAAGGSNLPIAAGLIGIAVANPRTAVLVVIGTHVMLYHSRWGLRTRAVGEHPKAAAYTPGEIL